MLGTIAVLGKSLNENPIRAIVDKTNAKHVFIMNFDNDCKYIGFSVNDNDGEEKYLYKYAKEGHKRGKFVTGLIRSDAIHELKKNLNQLKKDPANSDNISNKINEFKIKNILWIKKLGIFKNKKTLVNIPENSVRLLKCIINEIITQQDTIMNDFSEKVLHGSYEDILLTVTIGGKHLSEIEGFPQILFLLAQGEGSTISSTAKCIICNGGAITTKLKEPLPFFTIDKLNFIPGGNKKDSAKVFPICRPCSLYLHSGSKYIQKRLNFNIPSTYGHTKLRFWLIPQIGDPELIKEYIETSDKGLASFREMFRISKYMDMVNEIDLSSDISNITDNVLTYVAIFYYYDRGMRLIESVDGIYPPRFKELSKQKYLLDKIHLKPKTFKNNNAFGFYFGLIIDFLEKESRGENKQEKSDQLWMKTMSYIMSSIFTGKQIDEIFISKILLAQTRSVLSTNNLEQLYQIILKATLIVEYLHRVGTLTPSASEYDGSGFSPQDEKARYAADFLNSHSGILYNGNLRAVCAIGILVGITIKAQIRYFESDNAPFVSRLNRLEMDYYRLIDLPRQAWPKLKYYEAQEFEGLFTYLTNDEVSKLDFNQLQVIKKELMNLVFVIGMAHGFTIFNKFEKESDDNKSQRKF